MYKSKIGAKFRDNCFFQIYILLIEEKINVAQFKDNIKKYITIFVKNLSFNIHIKRFQGFYIKTIKDY